MVAEVGSYTSSHERETREQERRQNRVPYQNLL